MLDQSKAKTRILLLDYQLMFREGISLLLSGCPQLELVGSTGNRQEALALAQNCDPDVILLELNLDGEYGDLEVIPKLISTARRARIVLLTDVAPHSLQVQAVKKGVIGIVHKSEGFQTLVKAIEKVRRGEVWIDRTTIADALVFMTQEYNNAQQKEPAALLIEQLTQRERQMLQLVCRGFKNKDIAAQMSITESTVRHHLSSIYEKLHVFDRSDLIIFCFRNHVVDYPAG